MALTGLLFAWLPLQPMQDLRAQGLFGLIGDDRPPVDPQLPAVLPALSPGSLIEFYVSPTTTNRFAVDAGSVAIDQERLVRYTLVVTSQSGARNVSYEAVRCDRRERRMLALGRPDGSWSMLANGAWRPITTSDSVNRQHLELFVRLCEGGAAASLRVDRLVARLREMPRLDP